MRRCRAKGDERGFTLVELVIAITIEVIVVGALAMAFFGIFKGTKNGKTKRAMIYNVCDHAASYKEVAAQAVSYTTGVPPVVGAMMMFKGAWKGTGVFNVEQLPAKPFMDEIGRPLMRSEIDRDVCIGYKMLNKALWELERRGIVGFRLDQRA